MNEIQRRKEKVINWMIQHDVKMINALPPLDTDEQADKFIELLKSLTQISKKE